METTRVEGSRRRAVHPVVHSAAIGAEQLRAMTTAQIYSELGLRPYRGLDRDLLDNSAALDSAATELMRSAA